MREDMADHDDILFLIIDYLQRTALFDSASQLQLESGIDPVWLCGPNAAVAQLRTYILQGEFELALELLVPLQAHQPSTFRRVQCTISRQAFLEACINLKPVPARLAWLEPLVGTHEYPSFQGIAFSSKPAFDPALASWKTSQRRLECYTSIVGELRELPPISSNAVIERYQRMPAMHLRTLLHQALQFQASQGNGSQPQALDCLRADATRRPSSTDGLLRLDVRPTPQKSRRLAVALSMEVQRPEKTELLAAFEPPSTKPASSQTQSFERSHVGNQTEAALVHSTCCQTHVSTEAAQTQTTLRKEVSAGSQTLAGGPQLNASSQTRPPASVVHGGSQTPRARFSEVALQTPQPLTINTVVQTVASVTTTHDASTQANSAEPTVPSPIHPLPTAEPVPTPPAPSADFIRLSMTAPAPSAVCRNDMLRLSDGLAHLQQHSAQQLPSPLHRDPAPAAIRPATGYDASPPTAAIVVAETRESQAVRAMQVSHHGKYLLLGTNSRVVRVLNVRDALAAPRRLSSLPPSFLPVVSEHYKHHVSAVYCAAWNTTDTLVATGSNDGVIQVARPFQLDKLTATLYERAVVGPPTNKTKVRALMFPPTSDRSLASIGGYEDDVVRVWDLPSTTVAMHLPGHTGDLLALQYHLPAPHLLLSSAQDCTVRVWDTRSGCCEKLLKLPAPAMSMSCHPLSSMHVASAADDGTVALWDLRGRSSQLATSQLLPAGRGCRPIVEWSPHGAWLLVGGFDGSLLITNGSLGVVASYTAALGDSVVQATWHPTLPAFLTSGATKTVKLWAL
ncbi:hypothetical protein ACHHYP_07732 [Achlya hypogyna]|uniref:Uncharacterized protein n=1 Tax=Achlya hypogyna TaxID=1202772 RepID=A0A1V9ZLH3_ACHHY|nr:hypothetical protein ACHHYP_07732 [Achlya hypogyna]